MFRKIGSGGIRTHAPERTGALNQRLRPLGHATYRRECKFYAIHYDGFCRRVVDAFQLLKSYAAWLDGRLPTRSIDP